MDILYKIMAGVAIAGLSSLITVKLSLARFRTEKWWERRVEAYEKVIEAFHNSKKYFDEHIDAEYIESKVSEKRRGELNELSKKGRDEIQKAADVGSFLLSEEAVLLIEEYSKKLLYPDHAHTYQEYLDNQWSIIDKNMKKFIKLAKVDLKT
jgi:hypothetical protein